MSLVPTFIRCKDKRFYQGLVYWDEHMRWFICFDDQDPPEIVCERDLNYTVSDIEQLLTEIKIPFVRGSIKVGGASQRLFMKGPISYGPRKKDQRKQVFKNAIAYFFDVEWEPFPSPRPWDEFERDLDQQQAQANEGVFYGGSR